MVFTTVANFVRSRGPDEFWRKRKIFKLASHYIGRRRNVYTVAIRIVHRALVYATKARKLKKDDLRELRDTRIAAGCSQFGIELTSFHEALRRSNIMLNRKSLAELAIWEPKTMEAIAMIARERAATDSLWGLDEKNADNRVFYRKDEIKEDKENVDKLIPANYSVYYHDYKEHH